MFELKNYQKQALAVLENFLVAARSQSVESAFEQALTEQKQKPVPYRHYAFEEIPYVCLRLPTSCIVVLSVNLSAKLAVELGKHCV